MKSREQENRENNLKFEEKLNKLLTAEGVSQEWEELGWEEFKKLVAWFAQKPMKTEEFIKKYQILLLQAAIRGKVEYVNYLFKYKEIRSEMIKKALEDNILVYISPSSLSSSGSSSSSQHYQSIAKTLNVNPKTNQNCFDIYLSCILDKLWIFKEFKHEKDLELPFELLWVIYNADRAQVKTTCLMCSKYIKELIIQENIKIFDLGKKSSPDFEKQLEKAYRILCSTINQHPDFMDKKNKKDIDIKIAFDSVTNAFLREGNAKALLIFLDVTRERKFNDINEMLSEKICKRYQQQFETEMVKKNGSPEIVLADFLKLKNPLDEEGFNQTLEVMKKAIISRKDLQLFNIIIHHVSLSAENKMLELIHLSLDKLADDKRKDKNISDQERALIQDLKKLIYLYSHSEEEDKGEKFKIILDSIIDTHNAIRDSVSSRIGIPGLFSGTSKTSDGLATLLRTLLSEEYLQVDCNNILCRVENSSHLQLKEEKTDILKDAINSLDKPESFHPHHAGSHPRPNANINTMLTTSTHSATSSKRPFPKK